MEKKKLKFYGKILIGVFILVVLAMLFIPGKIKTLSFTDGCTIVGSATISSFDGRYIHIPASASGNGFNSYCLEIKDGTNSLNQEQCELIGWIWNGNSNTKCNPTDSLKNFEFSPKNLYECSLKDNGGYDWYLYHPGSSVGIAFDGLTIRFNSPTSGSTGCTTELLIDIIPDESECSQDSDCDGNSCFGYVCSNKECIEKDEAPSQPCSEAEWKNYPECSWDESKCTKPNYFWLILAGIFVLVLISVFIMVFIKVRRKL